MSCDCRHQDAQQKTKRNLEFRSCGSERAGGRAAEGRGKLRFRVFTGFWGNVALQKAAGKVPGSADPDFKGGQDAGGDPQKLTKRN